MDLLENDFDGKFSKESQHTCMLITNTKFTRNAINYGKCKGISMIGWSYPKRGNLQELIVNANIEPITALTTLNKHEKTTLMNEGLVLCKSIYNNRAALRAAGVSEEKARIVLDEVNNLCHV